MDGTTIRVCDEDSVSDEDIANVQHGSETTSKESMRKMFSQATAKRVVLNNDNEAGVAGATLGEEDNVAGVTGATLGEDQGAFVTR